MSWLCPKCNLNNVNFNKKCADKRCNTARPLNSPSHSQSQSHEDAYDEMLLRCRIHYDIKELEDLMTPNEALYAEFFNKHTQLVKDMDLLELRAYREKMSLIALEGKAAARAAKVREDDKQSKDGKPTGFERSVNIDEASTDAINAIKERQDRLSKDRKERLTKAQKTEKSLAAAGFSETEIQQLMSPSAILAKLRMKKTASEETVTETVTETKPFINPFENEE